MIMRTVQITVLSALVLLLVGCGKNEKSSGERAETLERAETFKIQAAGATFPYPLYSKMFAQYERETGVQVNYQSIGSGGGVRQISAKTVDFGASDRYLTDDKLADIEGDILHIPTCLGAVVATYNLPGDPQLKLTGEVLAKIFMGEITQWDNQEIAALNADVDLPSQKITVVHRSDGSGTTFIFTDYLSKVSQAWADSVGYGKSVKWPRGMGAKGNDGVAGNVKKINGGIGYCELAYSIENNMPRAHVKNASGNFIQPDVASISAAAQDEIPEDTRITLTNTGAEQGYPISSFTWLMVYKEMNDGSRSRAKAEAVVSAIEWMLTKGQKYTDPLNYAPLSEKAQEKALAQLRKVEYDGETLLK
ncbi:MAG: phosphate ABC transporter substrate-binding protein PstS [Fibrobacterota bacterium]